MPTRIRPRIVLSLLALLALALGISACGGGDDENVDEVLDQAFTTPIESGKLDLDTEVKGEGGGLDDPIRVKLGGPFKSEGQNKLPSFDLDLSVGGVGANVNGGITAAEDNLFVSFQGQAYEVGEGLIKQVNEASEKAQRESKQDGEQSFKSFGIDPRSWIKNGKDEGTEEVGGVETIHVSGDVDVAKMLEDLNKIVEQAGNQVGGTLGAVPDPLSEDQRKQISDAVGEPKLDVYVGKDDKALRRLSTDIEVEVPEDERDSVGGLEKAEVSFSISFTDVGQAQTIDAPSDAKPISELLNQIAPGLGGSIPGLGGDSGGSGLVPPGGSTTPSTPGSGGLTQDKARRYAECIDRVSPGDSDAVRRCLEILR